MYDVFLRQYIYVFSDINKNLPNPPNSPNPCKPVHLPSKTCTLARGKGLEGRGRGTAEIPQGYPRQSLHQRRVTSAL